MAYPMLSKESVRYTGAGGREHCSLCRHYAPGGGGRCARVLGQIAPRGWCKLFSQEVRALIADVGLGAAGGGAPALSLDFMIPGTLNPAITFTRASTATYFNSAGVMQTAAINAPRWDYDPATLALKGLLIEEARTNSIRNSTMAGAVPGTPGTLPTNWALNATTTGLSSQVVGTGVEDGIAYLDYRIFGTAASSSQFQLLNETTTAIAAATAQVWSFSQYWRLVGGTSNGITSTSFTIRECTAAGATVRENLVTAVLPTAAALRTQRYTQSATFSGGGTVGATHTRLLIAVATGAAIDITLRIGAPQLELGAFATSYIPTTSAAVTRAVDVATMPTAAWFDSSNGSMMAEAMMLLPGSPSNNQEIIAIGFNSAECLSHRTQVSDPRPGITGFVGGVNMGNTIVPTAIVRMTVFKTIISYARSPNTLRAALDGAAPVSTSPTSITSAMSLIGLGGGIRGGVINGYMRRVYYWRRVLSDAEMQSVTAP